MQPLLFLRQQFAQHPNVQHLKKILQPSEAAPVRTQLRGTAGAQASFVVAAVAESAAWSHLFLANTKEEALYRYTDFVGLLGDQRALFFPDSFKRPAYFDQLNSTQMLQRAETVSKLNEAMEEKPAPLVLTTYPEALFEKVVRPDILRKDRISIHKNEQLDVDFVISVLVEYHFQRTDFVYEPGQFSVRGGIIDLFSYSNDLPYRIELFDDEVESIRLFDPLTQLSTQNIDHLNIVPNLNTRFRQDQKVSLFQVLPPNTVLWMDDYQLLVDKLQVCFERAEQFAQKVSHLEVPEIRELFKDRAFLYPTEVTKEVAQKPIVCLHPQLEQLQTLHPDLFAGH